MNGPITSAQGSAGKSTIFFVNDQNNLCIREAVQEGEKNSKEKPLNYKDGYVEIANQDPECGSKDLAALAYEWGDKWSTRVYYSDKNNMIQEVCKDIPKQAVQDGSSSPKWTMGSLGQSNLDLQAVPGTSISAHINYNSGQLKVYFYPQKGT
ncbi:uncharacterized protein ALTATR162_LOCUS440 [Alternaria atra]|uniref:Uncharacterized protein n=1 Tax=Alternaria atra TaxID=119953 RepID=A0A8J2HSL5_9PLEO|nr:uncharacterized protein ALTATR162_LOCUS440 [Alternaria atra]CAG5138793.1 unnamed protein product [Alternaria atra]